MKFTGNWWRGLCVTSTAVVWAVWLLPPVLATSASSPSRSSASKSPLELAELHEKKGDWAEAYRIYGQLLRQDRNHAKLRARFRNSFRRYLQLSRHRDPSYLKDVVTLRYEDAIPLYRTVLEQLRARHVDRSKASAEVLARSGLLEFASALESGLLPGSVFKKQHLSGASPIEIRAFLARMHKSWANKAVGSVANAVDLVREVAYHAQKSLRLSGTVVVMEFACGACNALDEYTFYLTPRQYRKLYAGTKGSKFIGVGLELTERDSRVVVARVLPRSPADRAGVKPEDWITRIGKKSTLDMTPDRAQALINKGIAGSTVELGVSSDGGMVVRPVVLKRQRLTPRSVETGWMFQAVSMSEAKERTNIGYIQISRFQETTPQELDAALLTLKEGGMKALILDLRGNRGGSFEAGVECARRFLGDGVIVSTRGPDGTPTKFLARGGDSLSLAQEVPLVVLVDSYTASAAEVLAGALKDNGRTKALIGQTTFGKGCIQQPVPLFLGGKSKRLIGALRITTANYFSPKGQSYNGSGIAPEFPPARVNKSEDDPYLLAAQNLLLGTPDAPMPMPMNEMSPLMRS